MRIVLVHQGTKRPMAFQPEYGQPMFFTGEYRNCAIVSEAYVRKEMKRLLKLLVEFNHETTRKDPQ
jgi:hypothetical protein